jgi:hypothetical protein
MGYVNTSLNQQDQPALRTEDGIVKAAVRLLRSGASAHPTPRALACKTAG